MYKIITLIKFIIVEYILKIKKVLRPMQSKLVYAFKHLNIFKINSLEVLKFFSGV